MREMRSSARIASRKKAIQVPVVAKPSGKKPQPHTTKSSKNISKGKVSSKNTVTNKNRVPKKAPAKKKTVPKRVISKKKGVPKKKAVPKKAPAKKPHAPNKAVSSKKVPAANKKSLPVKTPATTRKSTASKKSSAAGKKQSTTKQPSSQAATSSTSTTTRKAPRVRGVTATTSVPSTSSVEASSTRRSLRSGGSKNQPQAAVENKTPQKTSTRSTTKGMTPPNPTTQSQQSQQQPPASTRPPASPFGGPGKKVKPPAPEEEYVTVLERNVKNRYYNRYKCNRCSLIFEGNADLIPRHITGIRKSANSSNRGLAKCPDPDPVAYELYTSQAAMQKHHPCPSSSPSPMKKRARKRTQFLVNATESSLAPEGAGKSTGSSSTSAKDVVSKSTGSGGGSSAPVSKRARVEDTTSPQQTFNTTQSIRQGSCINLSPNPSLHPQESVAAQVAMKFLFG